MATATTHETVVGVFNSRQQADRAMRELFDAGFQDDQVGFVARNAEGKSPADSDEEVAAGAATGLAVGATGGALVGAGIAAGVIPIIGPVLAVGTLGTILLNAAGGAAMAGIAGALVGWGVSDDDASYYETEVKNGKYLVTVEASGRLAEAQSILQRNNGATRGGWKDIRR